MSRSKQPKRVKGWMATWPDDTDGGLRATRNDAEFDLRLHGGGGRIARVVEVRRGEVVVGVQAVVDAYSEELDVADEPWNHNTMEALRAALRKVGVR